MQALPILYSFRRCPYAIRARMALAYSGINVELREIVFRDKPQAMLEASSKGTVPTLILTSGEVIDESSDVMYWALSKNDPNQWLPTEYIKPIETLIKDNDNQFKYYLDRYKYFERYPEQPQAAYRQQAEVFLRNYEDRLTQHSFLLGQVISLADIAIFPFIRQFAFVNKSWFEQAPYPKLNQWLESFLSHSLFLSVMHKYPVWQSGDQPATFPVL